MNTTAGSTEVDVSVLPDCDFCKRSGSIVQRKAKFDGKTTEGPWGYMCSPHFEVYGIGLGTGLGQRLVLKS